MKWNRTNPDPSHASGLSTHGVNVGQALQAPSLQYLLTGDAAFLQNASDGIDTVWRYHGQASGIYSAEDNREIPALPTL